MIALALEQHRLKVREARKGGARYFTAACTCGWVSVTQHGPAYAVSGEDDPVVRGPRHEQQDHVAEVIEGLLAG